MQIQNGTCTVTNGSAVVVAAAGVDWSAATVGSLFSTPSVSSQLYNIAATRAPGVSPSGKWELSLSAAYAQATNALAAYQIHKDFTPNLGFPILDRGDVDTAKLINKALSILDSALAALPGGIPHFKFQNLEDGPGVFNPVDALKLLRLRGDGLALEYVTPPVIAPAGPERKAVSTIGIVHTFNPGAYRITVDFSAAGAFLGGVFGQPDYAVLSNAGINALPNVSFVMMEDLNGKTPTACAFFLIVTDMNQGPGASAAELAYNALMVGYGWVPVDPLAGDVNLPATYNVEELFPRNDRPALGLYYEPTALVDGAVITLDVLFRAYDNSQVTLGGNRTLSIVNPAAGAQGTLKVKQDPTGGRTLGLPAGSKVVDGGGGVITLSAAPNAVDLLSWYYDGTNFFWFYGKNFS